MAHITEAYKLAGLPTNPRPFLNALYEGVQAHGTEWINSLDAKRLLFVVIMQSFKQPLHIDFVDLYNELDGTDRVRDLHYSSQTSPK
jgi:hypothetical protein